MKYTKSDCKHAEKYDVTYIKCSKDGSLRKITKGCPCKSYEETRWTKLKKKFIKRGKSEEKK